MRVVGRWNLIACAATANAISIGAIIGEWKACETRNCRASIPDAIKPSVNAAAATGLLETTTLCGPFNVATANSPDHGRMTFCTSCSLNGTDTIAPGAHKSCIKRPRSAIKPMASASEKTPDAHAAAYSPTLWPSIASGCIPQDCHKRINAY